MDGGSSLWDMGALGCTIGWARLVLDVNLFSFNLR
jgi:hypothetical protein